MLNYYKHTNGIFEVTSQYKVPVYVELNVKTNGAFWAVTKESILLCVSYVWNPVITQEKLLAADAIYSAMYHARKFSPPMFVTADTEDIFKNNMSLLFKSIAYEAGKSITDDLQKEIHELEQHYFTGE